MPDKDARTGQRYRARVFVDFWNYTLSMRRADGGFNTDWSRLGPVLASAAVARISAAAVGEYQGLNFYGSYDPKSASDGKLHRWATRTVARFPGVSVSMVPRQKRRSPPRCPACRTEVSICPNLRRRYERDRREGSRCPDGDGDDQSCVGGQLRRGGSRFVGQGLRSAGGLSCNERDQGDSRNVSASGSGFDWQVLERDRNSASPRGLPLGARRAIGRSRVAPVLNRNPRLTLPPAPT